MFTTLNFKNIKVEEFEYFSQMIIRVIWNFQIIDFLIIPINNRSKSEKSGINQSPIGHQSGS
uniref:Uncharacterized protein n=1 Tax=Rhizophagus irregularis (strain DAOM 181602 / DAOM 197198 / MUCL 43194) TaxID=747089 RepID=U9U8T3_RHIID